MVFIDRFLGKNIRNNINIHSVVHSSTFLKRKQTNSIPLFCSLTFIRVTSWAISVHKVAESPSASDVWAT